MTGPAASEMLAPVVGCWVLDPVTGQTGRVVEQQTRRGETMVRFQWSAEAQGWRRAGELRSAFQPGFQVEHVARSTLRASFGVGMVQATRRLAGCDQVLVQFFDSGLSRWLPFQVLRRVKPVENRLVAADTGRFSDHAERMRLRVLAHALEAWDQSTGALGRLDIDPLPHQIHVAHKVLSSGNPNWLIADDVGLGKTIEVGLILHAMAQRNQARRVLIVCPAGLVRQWQDEMRYKFDQIFEIYGRDFTVHDVLHWRLHEKVIASLDLAKRDDHRNLLRAAGSWDVVVFDEAHRLGRDEKAERTERHRLAEELRPQTPAMLLLTATPHQGRRHRFASLLQLVRPELTEILRRLEADPEIVSEVVIRNRKARVTDASGNTIFNGHDTHRVSIEPSPQTRAFDRGLQRYLRHGYALSRRAGARGRAIGFVMTTYRKLASSSIAAIIQALRLRRRRLLEAGNPARTGSASIESRLEAGVIDADGLAEDDALFDSPAFFDDEAHWIEELLALAEEARQQDEKLLRFLEEVALPLLERGRNLLVFTEYRATQTYLAEALAHCRPEAGEVALINGAMALEEKLANVRRFNRGDAPFLISTEAGGEGLNLHQACHVMANYDLPWNPSRLVQRIGRLYRYGQSRRVVVFNIQTKDSFDNSAIALMIDRVQTIARDLAAVAGDRRETIESEILGNLLDNIDLESILEKSTEMRLELADAELDAAIERARQAQHLQEEILAFADSVEVSGASGSLGVDRRHLESFVIGMLPYAGVTVGGRVLEDRGVDITLPEEEVGRFPEFGRRRHIRLAFDRTLAREHDAMFAVDLENSLVRDLMSMAMERAFDGLCAATPAAEAPGWLTIYRLRWQNDRGDPLEDEFFAVMASEVETLHSLKPDAMAERLLSAWPSTTASAMPASLVKETARHVERLAGEARHRHRHPGALHLVAAASLR